MKKIVFLIALTLPLLCYSQDYGIKLIYNISSHTNYNPELPEDGEFQWNYLSGVGAEVWYNFNLSNKFINNVSAGFQQKGYKETAQTGYIGGPVGTPISTNILNNRINVISIANDISFKFILNDKVELLPYLGVEFNAIIHKSIESELVYPIYEFYPVEYYQDNWNSFYFNYMLGVRLNIKDSLLLEGGFSRSITPIIKLDNLIVRDWIWFLKLGIPINNLLQKS